MALVLLGGLGIFWIPLLLGRQIGAALGLAAIPIAFFLSTFRGANTLRLDPRTETLTLRRRYFLWSRLLGQTSYGDVEQVSVDRRFVRVAEESPLLPLSVLLASVGIHVHFKGRETMVPAWDLVLSLRTTQVLVVMTCEEAESLEAAAKILRERLRMGPTSGP